MRGTEPLGTAETGFARRILQPSNTHHSDRQETTNQMARIRKAFKLATLISVSGTSLCSLLMENGFNPFG